MDVTPFFYLFLPMTNKQKMQVTQYMHFQVTTIQTIFATTYQGNNASDRNT